MSISKRQLLVLRNLTENKLIRTMIGCTKSTEAYLNFLSEIYSCGAENNLLAYVEDLILYNENPFSIRCAEGNTPSKYLVNAYNGEVGLILKHLTEIDPKENFELGEHSPHFPVCKNGNYAEKLGDIYKNKGYGHYIDGKAYKYADGKIEKIASVDNIRLADLKDYKSEKLAIINNVSDFLNGLPYAHTLLYGDRGTGKSSTVHAILNEYANEGLRLIEVDRSNLSDIAKIKQEIAKLPLKFIIYIDDLTLSDDDSSASALKAAVEGSVVAGDNCMIIATSNRRHIIKETFSGRDDSVHSTDCMEEQLSLSDRFGLTVMFSSTDKESYLSIVNQLADDMKLKTEKIKLAELAERWALIKGGRSPRKAKQFVEYAYSCEQSKRNIEF